MRTPEHVIKRPLLTEKTSRLKEAGSLGEQTVEPEQVQSQVVFEVAPDANKIEIRHAVEKLWKVDVVDVRTMVVQGKLKRVGRFEGKRSNWKKAIVTLAAGQNIEFFEGL